MDLRDTAAQADFLRGTAAFELIANSLDVWLMLQNGEHVVRREPVMPGSTVSYETGKQRVVYSGGFVYVIGRDDKPISQADPSKITWCPPPRQKRWWQR